MIHPIRFAKNAYGPAPSFAECDFARFLWLLRGIENENKNGKCISRGKIARALGVGEGSVRTMIRVLKENGLIEVKRRGCGITEKGRKTLEELGVIDAGSTPPTELSYGRSAFAVVVRVKQEFQGLGWRDEAVKAGADGATVLFFKQGALQLPVKDYVVRRNDAEKILAGFELHEGDAVVLSYGRDRLASERGAWAAALTHPKK